ncbi:ankyrin repeat-containing domain protein [Aspergillus heterothallicus]
MNIDSPTPVLPPEILYGILDSLATSWSWEYFPDSEGSYFLTSTGLRWYLNLRLVNRSFESLVFTNFMARALAPTAGSIRWSDRRALPPTEGAVAMGRRILKAALGQNCHCTRRGGGNAGSDIGPRGFQGSKDHARSTYPVTNIIGEAIDEMFTFFSDSASAAATAATRDHDGDTGADAPSCDVIEQSEERRRENVYMDAIISLVGALGADRVIELLLADESDLHGRETQARRRRTLVWHRTALMVTAYLGQVSELKTLMSLPGIDVSSAPDEKWLLPPLMAAGLGGYFNTVKVLVKAGVKLDSRTQERNETILHWAALGGHLKLVRFLLKEDDRLAELEDSEGHTPLVWALAGGCTAVARELLRRPKWEEKKGKRSQKGRKKTSLQLDTQDQGTASTSPAAATLFRYALLSRTLDPVLEEFPSILEQPESLLSAAAWGSPEQLQSVISNQKGSINHQDKAGYTALHHAVYSGNCEKVRLLLKQPGLDINVAPLDTGETPLHTACTQSAQIVQMLLARDDVEMLAADARGRTPLMSSITGDSHGISELLIQRLGTNIWQKDLEGETALSLAALFGDGTVVEHLLEPALDVPREIVGEAIHMIEKYLAGPKRLPKKIQILLAIRERQDSIRNGTYKTLLEYREQMVGMGRW